MKPDPDEFRRFINLLQDEAPAEYTPWLFRVGKKSKAPKAGGSWKDPDNRLTPEKAVEWMERGWNIGIAGCGSCPDCEDKPDPDPDCDLCGGDPESTADRLINVDIDDEDETTPSDLKSTLIARSRSRTGVHAWYFESDGSDIPNIPTDTAGEVRTRWQYVVAPGSYVPVEDKSALPDDQQDQAGYYTVEREESVSTLNYEELPSVFKQHDTDPDAVTVDPESMPQGQQKASIGSERDVENTDTDTDRQTNRDSDSELFDISAYDVVTKENGSTNPSDRWTSLFHDSDTGSNMSFGGDNDLLHCWRHECSHNGLQALATLSDYQGTCREIGSGHKQSNTGPSCLQTEGDAHIWYAWKYAKRNDYIPDGDPVPYAAIRHLCRTRDLCAVTELPTGDGDDESIPAAGWNAAISSIKDYDELNPGRPKTSDFDDKTTPPATDGGSAGASVTTSDAATATATQQPEGPSGPDVDTDTAALTPTNLKREAGIGDDESVDELTDRQKAAFIWELIKRNDRVHIRIVENDDIYAYDQDTGVWDTDDGDRVLKQAANRALPTGCYGSNVFEQLRSQVEADPHATMYRDDFGLPPGKIAVENGIVDLQKAYHHLTGSGSGDGDGVDVTDALRDLEPTDYALRRLNCSFDPTVDGSEFRSFVGEVVENTMIQTTQEYLGTCLYRGHLAEKALMLVGGGANGKSTFLKIIKHCLGKDNISSVTPGDYRNKNAIAKLDSKVANISAEVSGQTLQAESLNKFKNLTGDDDVMVEEKYQTPYQLNYTGGMIFATNEVPDSSHVSDDDFAFWRRWLIVQFPNEFPEGSDKRDPNIADRLQQDEHQSAVLNWMIEGLGRFRNNGDQFDNAPSTEETQRTWETWGDSLEYYLNNVAERDESADNISTGEAYAVYKQWCREQGESSVSRHKFTREAKSREFGYGGGGSTKIRTERESTPVRGYTCFGTSDAQPDPVEIVTDETAAVASGSIESYGDTDADDDDDVDVSDTDGSAAETESDDPNPDPDQDDQDESVDSAGAKNATDCDFSTTETESESESDDPDPDPDPDDQDQDQDQDQDRYESGDVDAPDSKYQRRGKLKGKLRAADTDEFMTAADLVAAFGWSRETIDATIEELRRDDVIFGSEKTGWKYDG